MDHSTERFYGQIILTNPLKFNLLVIFFIFIFGAIILFFFTATYTRKTVATGVLLPEKGLIKISSNQQGVVIKSNFEEGWIVKEGDTLFVIAEQQSENVKNLLFSRKEKLRQDLALLENEKSILHKNLNARYIKLKEEEDLLKKQIALQE